MADPRPTPKLDDHGVPHCTGARCRHHTRKERCELTGDAVESVCQPAVRELVIKVRAFTEAARG